jgi:hypothetical protein
MEAVGDKGSGSGAEDIREPVKGIVSGAAFGESLVVFVQCAYDCEEKDGAKDTDGEPGGGTVLEQEMSGEKERAAHEINEMHDLIEVRDLRAIRAGHGRERGEQEKCGRPQDHAKQPEARGYECAA